MPDIINEFEAYEMAYNAPFTGCFQEDTRRLFRLGAINEDETPREDVIRILARAFAAAFFDGFINGDVEDGELYFVYGVLSELWEKGDVYAVYLYLIFRYDAEIGGTPQKLVWFSKREDLLKLYLNHFVVAFKELVSGYEDVLDSEEDADDENDDEEGYTAEEDDAAESEETEDADAGLGEGDE